MEMARSGYSEMGPIQASGGNALLPRARLITLTSQAQARLSGSRAHAQGQS